MALEKITEVTGRGVHVPGDDIDTDRIIPARFMKCVTFDGLGDHLFHDVRRAEDGSLKKHNLNDPRFAGATILISGSNFGCGSSREHAPQAIYRAGFRAIIANGFAEIFFGNATQLGMPCVSAAYPVITGIARLIDADPSLPVSIDLVGRTVRAGDSVWDIEIRESARSALVAGRWDPITELIENAPLVDTVADRLAYV